MDEFDDIDKEIAKHLGIGLIKVTESDSSFSCHIVLEPEPKNPMPELLEEILRRKRILKCDSCQRIDQRDYTRTIYAMNKISKWTKDQIKKGKDLLITGRGFYCNTCARKLLQKDDFK